MTLNKYKVFYVDFADNFNTSNIYMFRHDLLNVTSPVLIILLLSLECNINNTYNMSHIKLEMTRKYWDDFAERFTETANRRMTLQCARHLHEHMQLDSAQNVLEVAAGAGLGSLDVVKYLSEGRSKLPLDCKRTFTVTDLSPVMIDMAKTNLSSVSTEAVEVQCREANGRMIDLIGSISANSFRGVGQNLTDIVTGSVNRYIASLCLQLAPDPDALLREASRVLTTDGIAGFTIWGSPDRSGTFVISTAANNELGLNENVTEHPNFIMGKDLPALRQRFAKAGFNRVLIWPFQCLVELWSGEDFAKFQEKLIPLDDSELRIKRFELVKRLADEWLAKGTPIGLETYIILARKA
ncbi:hypothetical protein PsorP6_015376 [Peronosclerospora sorghi]|uniref:Uncharacterized protein n=1 Tax=Peronosclerospora sorghi TaxID=230839 RepID=A0ACC0WQB2_9STRA|nr:hypothetical protein PsorP6_015376 [Peronosclerospora sorghi]